MREIKGYLREHKLLMTKSKTLLYLTHGGGLGRKRKDL